jgi:hypothetical protein
MSEKTTYLLLLGALLLLGYPIGCVLVKFGRAFSRIVGLVGMIGFLAGYFISIGTDDHRFRVLSACCLTLQVASLVSLFKANKTPRAKGVDLWAPGR